MTTSKLANVIRIFIHAIDGFGQIEPEAIEILENKIDHSWTLADQVTAELRGGEYVALETVKLNGPFAYGGASAYYATQYNEYGQPCATVAGVCALTSDGLALSTGEYSKCDCGKVFHSEWAEKQDGLCCDCFESNP